MQPVNRDLIPGDCTEFNMPRRWLSIFELHHGSAYQLSDADYFLIRVKPNVCGCASAWSLGGFIAEAVLQIF